MCGLRDSLGLGNRFRQAASLESFHSSTQRKQYEDEDETNSLQILFVGDFACGALLDYYGTQHAQEGK